MLGNLIIVTRKIFRLNKKLNFSLHVKADTIDIFDDIYYNTIPDNNLGICEVQINKLQLVKCKNTII